MNLAPAWRNRLAAIVAAIVATWVGYGVAQGEFFWPTLMIGLVAAAVVLRLQPQPLGTFLLGMALVGYIVGNRGFAQLSLANSVPVLPAEFVLMVAGALLLIRCAQAHEMPVRRDPLNVVILLWIVVSSVRLYTDFREFGFMAVRDYATIYYALFFFLGQDAAGGASGRRFLWRCVAGAGAALIVVYPLFLRFPDLFLGTLTLRGAPLIFFKGDLAGTFMAVASVLLFLQYEKRHAWWALLLSLALVGATIASNNRASLLGLGCATAALLLARRWRFAVAQCVAGTAAVIVLLLFAYFRNEPWEQTPLGGVYERVVSIADPMGQRSYAAADAANKGDNNLFRAVWWRAVFDETVSLSPWVGLGFGHDLAERFIREYYPESGEEFSTRSPHNILLTTFARTGVVGLLPLLGIVALMGVRTVKAARADLDAGGWWAAACVIFVSACFGVVLEGPMGAVVFWTLLGAANAAYLELRAAPAGDATTANSAPNLRSEAPADELAPAP